MRLQATYYYSSVETIIMILDTLPDVVVDKEDPSNVVAPVVGKCESKVMCGYNENKDRNGSSFVCFLFTCRRHR